MNVSQRRFSGSSVRWLLVLIAATFALYVCGLHIWYYGDDFQYVYADPASRIFYFFTHPNLYHSFYRPVNSAIIAIVQVVWGRETWPIHVVNMLVHAGLAWLVYKFMLREGMARTAALLGSLFMVVSQAGAGAVLGNDTFSQISGTFFGCLTLWALYRGYYPPAVGEGTGAVGERAESTGTSGTGTSGRGMARAGTVPSPWVQYGAALVWFVLCLASKETSVAFLPMVGLLLLVKNFGMGTWRARIVRTALEVAPFLALTLLYIGLRAAIGLAQPVADENTYGFRVGPNVLRNLLQFALAGVVPTSTSDLYVAVQTRQVLMLAVSAVGSLVFVVLVALGLRGGGRHRSLLLMGAFAFIGLFPAMLMNHVGELYLYNSLPFIAVIVGVGLGTLLRNAAGARRMVVVVLLVALAGSHAWAIQRKAAQMQANGELARRLLPRLAQLAAHAPAGARMFLVNPPNPALEYSVYLVNDFGVFRWGDHIIGQEAGRLDVEADVIEQGMKVPAQPAGSLVVTLRGDTIVPVTR